MKPAGFGRHERLGRDRDYTKVFARKRSAADASMVVYAAENGLEYSRLGISISRRKTKTAVARNRIKRIVRESFRTSKLKIPKGLDIVVVPRGRPLAIADTQRSLVDLTRNLARRLGIKTEQTPKP